jgi:uncharacterized membrane protein
MNKGKANIPAIIAYITWLGWFIALFVRDTNDRFATMHLNQALVLNILVSLAGILRIIPLLGSIAYNIVSIAVFILWCMGIYRAITWRDDPLPFIGDIHIIG